DFVDAFREGLSETGYVEGRNVTFQFRWAEGHEDRLPALAGDLVARQVAVIAVTGGLHPAVVAKAATSIIPIVFTGGGDPEKLGLVASLARPGANATGAINFSPVVTAKRLELFRQLLPTGSTIAVLSNPTDPNNEVAVREVQEAARSTGVTHQSSRQREMNNGSAITNSPEARCCMISAKAASKSSSSPAFTI